MEQKLLLWNRKSYKNLVMTQTTFFILILIALYLLYRYIEERLNGIERLQKKTQEKLDALEERCSPLLLLNIFNKSDAICFFEEDYISRMILNYNKAVEKRVSTIKREQRIKKQELERFYPKQIFGRCYI
jgi:hypothetical protein